jgi:putative PIN family toxin of toxin-antitoxin system
MIKVVLDTNVIVSAHLKPDGLERSVLNLALAERIHLYISTDIFAEYAEVLHRSKLKIDSD